MPGNERGGPVTRFHFAIQEAKAQLTSGLRIECHSHRRRRALLEAYFGRLSAEQGKRGTLYFQNRAWYR